MEDDRINQSDPLANYFIRFIIAIVSFGGYIGIHQINFSTNQLINALNIFPHKVNIYMSKLLGFRSVFTIIGALTHHLISVYYSKNYTTFSIVSLCSIFFSRLILLIVLYKSLSLSFYFFIILSLEAFVSGFFQNSLFVIVPEYTSTIILSVDISLMFSLGIKLIICYFCKRDLIIIKVQSWISLSINTIILGLLLFYSFYYYKLHSDFYKDGIDKIKSMLEVWTEINNCSKQIECLIKPLNQMKDTINEMDKLEMKDVIDNKIKNQKNILEELKYKLEKEYSVFSISDHFEKTKNEIMTKLEEFRKKINESKDFKMKSKISDNQCKKLRKIKELYEVSKFLYINIKQINVKIEEIKNIQEETKRIKARFEGINENIETINRMVNSVGDTNKDQYIPIVEKLKTNGLQEKTREIKINIEGFKKKMGVQEILNKMKPEMTKLCQKMDSQIDSNKNNVLINVKRALNQYLTVLVSSVFKNFLYPKIIPQSFLESNKCQLIEKISTIFYFIGSLTVFSIYSHVEDLEHIKSYLDFLAILNIIPFAIFVISLIAIHIEISIFRKLICSQYKILSLTSILIISFRIIESYTYVSISDIVEWVPEYNYSVSVLTLHHILTILYSYIFDKISNGYIDTMSSLGYTIPFLESDNKRKVTFCYFLKNTIKSTFKNIIFDLKPNIREYI